jgi:tetratricopeptide (TPR) repeat protein
LVDAGLAAERLGHYSAAERLLEQAVIRDPAEFAASYDLGVLYQTQGRDEQAIAEYVRVNAADPTYVPALYNAATIYSSSNPQLAMSTYRKVVVVQPNDSAAYLNLGLLEARGHELTRARADLLRAIRLQPSLAAAVPRRLLASLDLMTTTTGSDRRQ